MKLRCSLPDESAPRSVSTSPVLSLSSPTQQLPRRPTSPNPLLDDQIAVFTDSFQGLEQGIALDITAQGATLFCTSGGRDSGRAGSAVGGWGRQSVAVGGDIADSEMEQRGVLLSCELGGSECEERIV